MVQVAEKQQENQADYEAPKGNVRQNGSWWLAPLRERAWTRFNELGFPTATRGNELVT